jgi:hypothetical protein
MWMLVVGENLDPGAMAWQQSLVAAFWLPGSLVRPDKIQQ